MTGKKIGIVGHGHRSSIGALAAIMAMACSTSGIHPEMANRLMVDGRPVAAPHPTIHTNERAKARRLRQLEKLRRKP